MSVLLVLGGFAISFLLAVGITAALACSDPEEAARLRRAYYARRR